MWNALMAYAHATGDNSYNDVICKGILAQAGPENNFMPPNWTATLGNDDQGMWAMAAMTAAEVDFAEPTAKPDQAWFALVKNVFDSMTSPDRWNETGEDSCGGGLRWQVPLSNAGYDYKNSISTGVLFNIASRLARATNSPIYASWAEKTWTWMESVGFLVDGAIYDGAHVGSNCTDINKSQFSYNLGVFVEGAAHMYNLTNGVDNNTWKDRLDKLVGGVKTFTDGQCVLVETSCEKTGSCTTDMLALKSVLLRGLAATVQYAPYTRAGLDCVLAGSAAGAGASCADAADGAQCGFMWTTGSDDGEHGAGQQMNALAALTAQYQLRAGFSGSTASSSGGQQGNAGAGASGNNNSSSKPAPTGGATATTNAGAGIVADRAGAGFLVAGALLAAAFTGLLA
jgi:mannan endo-1,6-alpha-mannosidase